MNGAWLEKSCFEVLGLKERPKYTQNEVFPALWKINGEIFLFLYEVIVAYKLKIDLNNFFVKILFQVFGPKGSWNGPKSQTLFQLIFQIKSQCIDLFWVFCMTLHHHNNLELIEIFFLRINLFLKFWGQKWPTMGPIWGFSGIIKIQCMEIFWFFAWNYSRINYNWTKWLFEKTLFLSFWAKRDWGKMAQNEVFHNHLMHWVFWFFGWT